ncbi:MAG: ABC transporter ATP-binding protein [Candidatus Midichloria sp.]|nr:MAG: ABC transporter ATP-binding protein [Candidatus Midichloria sp.]
MNSQKNLIELQAVDKNFVQGQSSYVVFENINFTIRRGEIISIVGHSGSGKSTLLHILGLIDLPTSGRVLVESQECSFLSDYELTEIRKKYFGFIYQVHHLLPEFSAIENLKIANMIASENQLERSQHEFLGLLDKFGLRDKANNYPSQLSGGERQRVAIARAMVNQPKVILADEPTGNLDQNNANMVLDLLLENVRKENIATIIVTHNMELAKKTNKVFLLANGKLELLNG